MTAEILTPTHPRWEDFYDRLAEALGDPEDNRCAGRGDPDLAHQYAREALEEMGNVDIEGTLAYCEAHSGRCDCAILMNVEIVDAN
jgi:hypothetical protein